MAALFKMSAHMQPVLTAHEALSGVFGSISLVSWIVVLVPQLVQNYRTGSAEAISIPFLTIWFIGDICSLIGAVWAKLVPTVIALAVYFCFADLVLIIQCLYYNYKNGKQAEENNTTSGSAVEDAYAEEEHEVDEESPLLSRTQSASSGNVGLPGSMRRKSSAASRKRADSLAKVVEEDEEDESSAKAMMKNLGSILVICAVGAAAWAICWKFGIWKPAPEPRVGAAKNKKEHAAPLGAEILGYASAVAYLGARIPQIVKNWREKSCEGLSLLFFLLSLLGNITYGLGILCHSLDRQYIMTNLPWLIGSLGTIFEDIMIYLQFYMYRR